MIGQFSILMSTRPISLLVMSVTYCIVGFLVDLDTVFWHQIGFYLLICLMFHNYILQICHCHNINVTGWKNIEKRFINSNICYKWFWYICKATSTVYWWDFCGKRFCPYNSRHEALLWAENTKLLTLICCYVVHI